MDPVLDGRGWLVGNRLTLGDLAGRAVHRLDLPPEAFASGPVHGRVLVGDDDGTRSRLRLIDVAAGCTTEIGREASVVRSGVVSADGRQAWEHRVNRRTRADEGIWRRSVALGTTTRVLDEVAVDEAFGPTFSTELDLADDGRLTIASCGDLRCRLRVLAPESGSVDRIDGTGPLIGLSGDRAIVYAACHGFPCPIETIQVRTGRRTTLVDGGGLAALGGPDDSVLAYETSSGSLATLDLRTNAISEVPGAQGLPVRRGSGATSGATVPPGAVLVAPSGHVSGPGSSRILDIPTGMLRPLPEVAS